MKRSSVAALLVGVLVSAAVIALYAMHLTLPLEQGLIGLLSGGQPPSRVVGAKLQSVLVVILSLGVAWLILSSSRRKRLGIPVAILAVELAVIATASVVFMIRSYARRVLFALAQRPSFLVRLKEKTALPFFERLLQQIS